LADLQKRSALLPDYALPAEAVAGEDASEGSWPAIAADTSAAGVIGGLLTLAVLAIAGMLLKRRDETVRSEE
jgi:cobalt/nickel transport system permease protein